MNNLQEKLTASSRIILEEDKRAVFENHLRRWEKKLANWQTGPLTRTTSRPNPWEGLGYRAFITKELLKTGEVDFTEMAKRLSLGARFNSREFENACQRILEILKGEYEGSDTSNPGVVTNERETLGQWIKKVLGL